MVNLDSQGARARQFLQGLDRAGGYRVVEYTQAEAEQALNKLKLGRYLVIPTDFSAGLDQGEPVAVTLVTHPNTNPDSNQTVWRVVNGVAADLSLELQIIDGIQQMAAMQAGNPADQLGFTAERVLAQARSQFDRSRQTPLVAVVETTPQREPEKLLGFDLSQTVVPGMTVLFVFLAAQTVARSIFDEKKSGSLRRLLAAPLSRAELLLGKMLPILILTLVQIGFIFLAGNLLLPLLGFGRLGIGSDPLAWAVASLVIALCSTCLGILIAGVARTEGQITGLSNALLWVAGFLGGALIPAFIIETVPVLGTLARLMPHYWANTAYYDLLARGLGLADILPGLGVLLAFSAVFFFVGERRFRFQ